VKAWEERLAFRGAEVEMGEQRGILVGLSPEGGLLLETNEGLRAMHPGASSLRPVDR
jgi:hypothetical protein